MIRIDQIKIPLREDDENSLRDAIAKRLMTHSEAIRELQILRRSVDARKKPEIYMVYSVAVTVKHEDALLRKDKKHRLVKYQPVSYAIPRVSAGSAKGMRPAVIGAGPAGLFAAYALSQAGLSPILIERGEPVEQRTADVEAFFASGKLLVDSNVLFGEGGAGTFSDGKLNTSVKDKTGRHRFVLETFVKYGADASLLYEAKPHIGTDQLLSVIPAIRRAIIEAGGEVRFGTRFERLVIDHGSVSRIEVSREDRPSSASGAVRGIEVSHEGRSAEASDAESGSAGGASSQPPARLTETIACDTVILATGHSARDTFASLYGQQVPMQAKEFAVGFRVEHPQRMIDESQYGSMAANLLPAAPYKLVAKGLKRPVYSFCMCPGGYVVNSSSEEVGTCVNGMSYAARDGENANSAIVVAVGTDEYDMGDPMAAIAYQRKLERAVFERGSGAIVQQLYGDFLEKRKSTSYGGYGTKTKGKAVLSDLRGILSAEMEGAFIDGMRAFDEQIKGFASPETILSGIESRTSSPIRIVRDTDCMSPIAGLYPCGEGAGYAGGIASAAMDGLRVAEAVIARCNNGM